MASRGSDITVVLLGDDGNLEPASKLLRAAAQSLLLVVGPAGIPAEMEGELTKLLIELKASNAERSCTVATKDRRVLELAEKAKWNTIDRIGILRSLIRDHPLEDEALRVFSPGFWRGHIRSQLQSLGLLSLPKLRIWILLIVSIGVFLFIILRLLPSATIAVWPTEETITHTVNVYLVASGSVIEHRVRTLPLYPLTVHVQKTLTFNEIGKEFTGKNAEVLMTVVNDSLEPYALRQGTRLTNQAGMVFRLQEDVVVPAKSNSSVKAVADPKDLYDEIVGERGNVPAGLKWEFPGLGAEERKLVYGRNDQAAVGGTSSFVNMLRPEDLVIAQKKLEKDLMLTARQQIDEEREMRNAATGTGAFVELRYDELTHVEYDPFDLPNEFIGTQAASVPISGGIRYTVLLYDENALFEMLRKELLAVASEDMTVLPDSINKSQLVLHVIDAPWDAPKIDWVKITVDLSAQQQFNLDESTPAGMQFSRAVREAAKGMSVDEAEKVIKNMPEVANVEISMWPPWNRWLPSIPSNIVISPQQE